MRNLAGVTLFSLLLCGCGSDLEDVPETLPVTGSVTLDGSPLPDATVVFSDGKQLTAMGVTDGSGKFSLKTRFNSKVTSPGAPPREYWVTVSKSIPPGGMAEEIYQTKKRENRELRAAGQIPKPQDRIKPRVQIIPRNYSSANQTQLRAVVKTGQSNDFPFALQSKP